MFPFNLFKKGYEVADDFREEFIDDVIISGFLDLTDENTKVDELEEKGLIVAMTAASKYASRHGLPDCPYEVKKQIAKKVVQKLGVLNRKLKAQAIKKNDNYIKRHESDG